MQLYLVAWWRNARWLSALTGDRGTLAGNGSDAMVSQTMTTTRLMAGYPRACLVLLSATLG